jgi:hypothetical protein
MRGRIRKRRPQLQTLFLMRIASLNYRLQLPGFELPEAIRLLHRVYDDRSAEMLDDMADRIEGKTAVRLRITSRKAAVGSRVQRHRYVSWLHPAGPHYPAQ